MPDPIPCYVINLRSETGRRDRMKEILAAQGVSPTFFEAVDGRKMARAELDAHVDAPLLAREYGALSNGEIGCALSHLAIYRDIVARNHRAAVILEDDVCVADDFGRLLNSGFEGRFGQALSSRDPEMLQLTKVARGYRFTAKPLAPGRTAMRPASSVWLASGYMINLAGAKSLSEHLHPLWTVADQWSRFQEKGLIRLWASSPAIVWESEQAQASSLEPSRASRLHHPKTLRQRVARLGYEIGRPFLTRAL